jgi:hypothetical protein
MIFIVSADPRNAVRTTIIDIPDAAAGSTFLQM